MKKEKSAGAILFKKNGEIEYLLLHYEEGHWDFPKGHIEENETDIEALKREIVEETSIKDVEIIKCFKENIHYFFRSEGGLVSKDVVFYLVKTKTKRVKLSHEHIGFKWLSFDESIDKLTFKNARNILKKANDVLKKV
jgi:8-oxo-dGTP pyrophosphatase MutT (NUDIX family)